MEENQTEIWDRYCSTSFFIVSGLVRHDKIASKAINRIINPSILFDFLVEHREDWEWIKCPKCDVYTIDFCVNCGNKGKVQHPAAVYLDNLRVE